MKWLLTLPGLLVCMDLLSQLNCVDKISEKTKFVFDHINNTKPKYNNPIMSKN